jgi:hypothetical protein
MEKRLLKLFLSEELKTSSISSELVHELTVLFPTCKKNGFLCAVLLLGSLAHLVLESDVSSALEEQRRLTSAKHVQPMITTGLSLQLILPRLSYLLMSSLDASATGCKL